MKRAMIAKRCWHRLERFTVPAGRSGVREHLFTFGESDAVLAERELITLLSQKLIPSEAVRAEDFSSEARKKLVECLISGGDISGLLEAMTDEDRRVAMEALNFEPIPSEREEALKAAKEAQTTIRKSRLDARARQIQEEIKTAGGEKKRMLYEQLLKINEQLED